MHQLYRPAIVGYGLEKGSRDVDTPRGVLSTRMIKYRIEPNTTPCIRTRTETATPKSETLKDISLLGHVMLLQMLLRHVDQ